MNQETNLGMCRCGHPRGDHDTRFPEPLCPDGSGYTFQETDPKFEEAIATVDKVAVAVVRIRCDKHQVALEGPDAAPFLIPSGEKGSGDWEMDLSDMMCPLETITDSSEPEDDWCSNYWSITLVGTELKGMQEPGTIDG